LEGVGLRGIVLLLLVPWSSIVLQAGPAITGVQVSTIEQTSAVTTWSTDVPSTSEVIFTTGPGDDYTPLRRIPEDSALTNVHIVTLPQLRPDTQYWIYVVSRDQAGQATSTQASNVKFTTLPAPETGELQYRLYAAGPRNVYAGSDLYFQISSIRLSGVADHLYFKSITGLPETINAHLYCRAYAVQNSGDEECFHAGDNTPFSWLGTDINRSEPINLRLRTLPTTPPGPYKVTVQTQSGSAQQTIEYTFNVVELPSTPVFSQSVAPPIPGLGKWEKTMLELGRKWCDPAQVMSFGVESQVWYYDGGRVYYQIADYTKDPSRLPCADNILTQYRTNLITRSGGIQGWRVFPHGLAMHYWRTGDALSKSTVALLITGNPWVSRSGSPDPLNVREAVYAVETMVKNEQLTGQRDWHLDKAIDYLIGDVDILTGSDPNGFQQTFFDGLLMEGLIQYHELTGDARIPPTIKKMLDWIWTHSWDASQHRLQYNPLDVPGQYTAVSNLLVAPAYAWYWSVTGDNTYLTRGDEIFNHALDEDITYSGKIFSQNFRWSFDYVRWRSGGIHSSTFGASNDLLVPKPLIGGLEARVASPSTATLKWVTNLPTNAQVLYGPVGGEKQSTQIFLPRQYAAEVALTDLKPDTAYEYVAKAMDQNGALASASGTFQTPPAARSEATWFDRAWSYRTPILIDPSKLSNVTTLTRVPVLVDVTLPGLRGELQGGHVSTNDGSDLVFADANGNRLSQERESYDSTTGRLVSWIQVIDPGQVVFLYFGNSGALPYAPDPAVWDSYAAVWHLSTNNGVSGLDSTVNNNHGRVFGALPPTEGVIGGAARYQFDRSTFVSAENSASLRISGTALTLEAWVKPGSTNEYQRIVSSLRGDRLNGYELYFGNGSIAEFGVRIGDGKQIVGVSTVQPLAMNRWSYVAATYDGANILLYVNGQPVATRQTGPFTGVITSEISTDIGRSAYWPTYFGLMDIDEVRVSSVPLSAAWVAAQYQMQLAPGSLLIVESTEMISAAATTVRPGRRR
jgi:Concanavalin A-like lectin/glucanases superfamily